MVKGDLVQDKAGKLVLRYHVLVTTDDEQSAEEVLVWHLQQANMENRIKEHKSGFG